MQPRHARCESGRHVLPYGFQPDQSPGQIPPARTRPATSPICSLIATSPRADQSRRDIAPLTTPTKHTPPPMAGAFEDAAEESASVRSKSNITAAVCWPVTCHLLRAGGSCYAGTRPGLVHCVIRQAPDRQRLRMRRCKGSPSPCHGCALRLACDLEAPPLGCIFPDAVDYSRCSPHRSRWKTAGVLPGAVPMRS